MNERDEPLAEENRVYCTDIFGQLKAVPQEEVVFSPAVFGLLIEEGQVLLCHHEKTQLYLPPGGLVAAEQTAVQAMKHHFRAATGITPIVGKQVLVEEAFELDGEGKAWHLSRIYYSLQRPTRGREALIDFENPSRPEWISLANLVRDQMQMGFEAVRAAMLRWP